MSKQRSIPQQHINPEFLRPAHAAKLLSVSRSTLNKWVSDGLLPVIRISSRCTLFSRVDLIDLVQRSRTGGPIEAAR